MSMLKRHLKQLLTSARSVSPIPQRRTLPKKLTLQIVQERSGDVVLTLERRDVWPSSIELRTILDHWPEQLPNPRPLPAMRKEGKLYRLIARWPRPLPEPELPLEAAA